MSWHKRQLSIDKLKTLGDPWSSLGPNTKVWAATTPGGVTIPAYYKRQFIRLSIDTSTSTAVVYGWLGSGGPPTATNFHFALSPSQPPLELEYTGPITLVSSSGTIYVGAVEG